jgi:putative ABC transport system permease protein
MKPLRRFWNRLRGTVLGQRMDDDFTAEIESHLRMQTEDNMRAGMSATEARRAAALKFGGIESAKEHYSDEKRLPLVDSLVSDARLAVRGLAREPRLTAVAAILIALVVGGNTTIYSMVHGLLAKPAPGVTADRLVTLNLIRDGRVWGPETTYQNYLEFAAQSETVRPLLGYGFERFTVGLEGGAYALRGALITANYFETLGIRPFLGRVFTESEYGADAEGLAALISERLWRSELNAVQGVVGLPIVLNGHPATVVGVLPPAFQGATIGESADLWVPLASYARIRQRTEGLDDWSNRAVVPIGKLAPHVSFDQAQAEIRVIAERLEREDPKVFDGNTVELTTYSMLGTGSPIHQLAPRFMAVFSVVTGLTLMIVCANVANLMLARSIARRREIGIRLALGASRGRIFRLLSFEGLGLALAAWVFACLLAAGLARGLAALIPPDRQGALITPDFDPDWQVALYAMAMAVLAGFLFSVVPAVRAWRLDVLSALKAGQHNVIQGRSRMATGLVLVQLAFSVLLLTSAGLAYRSLRAIDRTEPGFQKKDVLLVTVNTTGVTPTSDSNGVLLERLRDRLQSVPGVAVVSYAAGVPGSSWAPEELRTDAAAEPVPAQRNDVGPGYFDVLGVAPLSGRTLLDAGRKGTNVQAVLTQSLAEALWPGHSPVGWMVALKSDQRAEVVGVVPNGFFSGFERDPRPHHVFVSMRQTAPDPGEFTFHIKSAAEAMGRLESMGPAVRVALRDVDARIPVVYMRTMETQLRSVTWLVRVVTILLTVFAAGALVIAALGQYSVMEFTMRRRTRDVGVRMALGATSRRIIHSVVREGLLLTAFGLLFGFALSVIAGSAFRALLVGVTPTDAMTYLGVLMTLGAVSMLACYVPARRATGISLVQALRED